MKNKTAIIITITAVIVMIILAFNTKEVIAYGTIKGNFFSAKIQTEVINCELEKKEYRIINPFLANNYFNNKTTIKGITLFDMITIILINNSYNYQTECYEVHKEDIIAEPLNYNITKDTKIIIEYEVNNNQDMRLIYRCEINTDCEVTRSYFTNYLNPQQKEIVYFEINCNEGIHEATIETLFIDELDNRHSTRKDITINAI